MLGAFAVLVVLERLHQIDVGEETTQSLPSISAISGAS